MSDKTHYTSVNYNFFSVDKPHKEVPYKFVVIVRTVCTYVLRIYINLHIRTSNNGHPKTLRQCRVGNSASLSISSHVDNKVLFRFRNFNCSNEPCAELRSVSAQKQFRIIFPAESVAIIKKSVSIFYRFLPDSGWLSPREYDCVVCIDFKGQSARTRDSNLGNACPSLLMVVHVDIWFPAQSQQLNNKEWFERYKYSGERFCLRVHYVITKFYIRNKLLNYTFYVHALCFPHSTRKGRGGLGRRMWDRITR